MRHITACPQNRSITISTSQSQARDTISQEYRILRISLLIPTYSLFSFLSITYPTAHVYLQPWLEVFQANSLAAFFLLMSEFISDSHQQRDIFLATLEIRDKKSPNGVMHGIVWFRVSRRNARQNYSVTCISY